MEMIAISAAGLVGAAGAIVCVVAWNRGARVPPALAVATVALPAVVGLLAAEMALLGASESARSPALAVVAPYLASALISRELAFYAALVPGLCLVIGSCLAALKSGDVRFRAWALMVLAFAPVLVLPVVHGVLQFQIGFGVARAAAYLALAVTAGALVSTSTETLRDARQAAVVALAVVVAVGEAAALAGNYFDLFREIGQMGAVSREALDLAVGHISSGLPWLTVTAAWAGVAAILAVVRGAGVGPARTRALVVLLWLAPVPLAFLAGDVTGFLLTVI